MFLFAGVLGIHRFISSSEKVVFRSCRINGRVCETCGMPIESSHASWGKSLIQVCPLTLMQLIPAYAGLTHLSPHPHQAAKDHPRLRGAN